MGPVPLAPGLRGGVTWVLDGFEVTVVGAVVFGDLTDRLDRKKLVTVTLAAYIPGPALAVDYWTFALGRRPAW